MRRSAAPSLKVGVGSGVNGSADSKSQQNVRVSAFPKATRTTESILDLLDSTKEDDSSKSNSNSMCISEKYFNCQPEKPSCSSKLTISDHNEISNVKVAEKSSLSNNVSNNTRVFNVVWGKQSTKKHKTWEGDGTLEVQEKSIVLKDTEGKILGQTSHKSIPLEEGSRLFVGNKEIEIIDAVEHGECEQVVDSSKRTADRAALKISHPSKRARVSNKFSIPLRNPLGYAGVPPHTPLVMPQPPHEHQWKYNTACLPVTDVTVDPFLARILRPHQREGIIFLYECVMGMRKFNFKGAILADEMGLGKTLQCITLTWILLKKGPYGGIPVLKRVLVVTPSSLVSNWEKEFLMWLGRERISLFVVNQKSKPRDYGKYKKESVMLISYEMFLRYCEDVSALRFDLLICDEGHRLKNSSIKISNLLSKLRCNRKIILTGTPVQNDLREFFCLVDFVNPGVLSSLHEFRRYFEGPIVASHQPHAEKQVKDLGESRTSELNSATKWFILRRTQDVINKFLPTKEESVIFCDMSPLQKELYKAAVLYWTNREELSYIDNIAHLSVITALKKICNHPCLVLDKSETIAEYLEQICLNKYIFSIDHSGKLVVLMNLLQHVNHTREKTVVVSYYTQTLDMLAKLLTQKEFKYCRLDGSVPSGQRQKIVDQFNSTYSDYFVFLLSARAGGVGLNLTGASRLVLYDCDWNPATDLQAMSRIWRDGQKRAVHIYRLLTTGSIEEKMFQRQLSKAGLSGAVVDPFDKGTIKLSSEELKDLFTVHDDVSCLTHDVLRCECNGSGEAPGPPMHFETIETESSDESCLLLAVQRPDYSKRHMHQLFKWEHHRPPFNAVIFEKMGLSDSENYITYMFRNISALTELESFENASMNPKLLHSPSH